MNEVEQSNRIKRLERSLLLLAAMITGEMQAVAKDATELATVQEQLGRDLQAMADDQ